MTQLETTALSEASALIAEAPVATTPPRKVVIDPELCTLDSDGQCWRVWRVRLPKETTFVDLNEDVSLWRQVQLSQYKSLRRFDRLTIISYAEDWLADCVVSSATNTHVTLAGIRRIDLGQRRERLPFDDDYTSEWVGSGYVLVRRSDRQRVSPIVQTIHELERELAHKHPSSTAGVYWNG